MKNVLKHSLIFLILISCNQRKDNCCNLIDNNFEKNKKMNLVENYWKEFQIQNPKYKNVSEPESFHFCDNRKDADECAELVVKKIKKATSPSVWWFKKNNIEIPKIGDIAIVTNWNNEPKAIIKTIKIEIVKYKNITSEYAFIEGEGDKSLEYWKKTHWNYYRNEMKKFNEYPNEEMEIVCEYFETIWTN